MIAPTQPEGKPCFECETGVRVPVRKDYKTFWGKEEITVPNILHNTCNQCGTETLPASSLKQVETYVDEVTGRMTERELKLFLTKYNLTVPLAAEMLGIGEKTYFAWLKQPSKMSRSNCSYLRLLLNSEKAFDDLRSGGSSPVKVKPASETSMFVEQQPDADEKEILSQLDYAGLVKLNLVKKTQSPLTRRTEICSLFKVNNIIEFRNFISEEHLKGAAFKDTKYQYSQVNAALWTNLGIRAAKAMNVSAYSKDNLHQSIPLLLSMTPENPSKAMERIQSVLANAGVALVIIPMLKNMGLRGYTRLLSEDKAAIIHTFKYKSNDQFWFTLFHEIAHLILHINSTEQCFEDYDDAQDVPEEVEANEWAADTLISTHELLRFMAENRMPKVWQIEAFAKRARTAPAIVASQLNRRHKMTQIQGGIDSPKPLIDHGYLNRNKVFVNVTDSQMASMWKNTRSLIQF